MRWLDWQRSAFCSLLSVLRAACRSCRSSATCSTVIHGLTAFLYLLIVIVQKWSHTEVRSIAILLRVHNTVKGRAYITGGILCQDAQQSNCTQTASVEMLDMSLGAWQTFSVPLGRTADNFQIAMLDYELGALQRTNGIVNEHFFRQLRLSD